jgi:hypothetical protein
MKKPVLIIGLLACVFALARPFIAASPDIVLYASDVTTIRGNWTRASASGGAEGQAMRSADNGAASTDAALASPADYFEASFTAAASTPYHVWVRMRATGDSKWNDSAWVQFSDAVDAGGSALYRTGTSSALLANLEGCSGCGVSGWGWVDGAWWVAQTATVRFSTSGTHTVRVQMREDGVQIDQIVLSPSTYLSSAPGGRSNDSTIVPRSSSGSSGGGGGGGLSPFTGTPAAIPGTIPAANYDNGGEGVAYHDTSSGNSGGAYRSDNVDIESSADGGYDVGWTAAGEFLNYTVSVASSGNYTAQIRVASPGGGALHLGFATPSGVWTQVAVPATGDWQAWTTVSVPVTLAAGTQTMTVMCDTNGFNIGAITVSGSGGSGGGGGTTSPTPYTGTPAAIPGTIQAENYDNGGEGVAYHDTTSGNSGGQYRSNNVDIEAASGGGYDVGWLDVGEWLGYTVNVASAGSYTAAFRVAAAGNGGTFHLEVGGQNVSGPLTIPNTGGWQTWTTVSASVTLPAGKQFARFIVDGMGSVVGNLDSIAFSAGSSSPPVATGGGNTITVGAGGDLQAAIDRAQQGDTILLTPGATYTGGFVLRAKSGSGTITIRSAASDGALPPAGVRISPDYAGSLPKVRGTAGSAAFSTEAGAHDYRLLFLELTSAFYGSDLVEFGDGSSLQSSLSNMPQNLTVDRCYLHGDPSVGQKRGVALNSGAATVMNSYISDIKSTGLETQAIAGWNGPGPYTIANNYLEAASEVILFGGDDPKIQNLVPSDITITRNRITRPTSWWNVGYAIKNLIELKNAQRVTIDGNIIENNWLEGQAGYAIVLTPRNQDHSAPWSAVQHVAITNNVVQHVAGGINILGIDDQAVSQPLTDVLVANNLFLDLSVNWGGSSGWFLLTQGGSNIRFDHNTIFSDGSSVIFADTTTVSGFSFTNNILPPETWSIIGTAQQPGNNTIAAYFPGSTFARNIITGASSGSYPANNYYPATTSAIGFVSVSGGNYRLSSSSQYKGKATDGSDVGVNIDALNGAAGTSY